MMLEGAKDEVDGTGRLENLNQYFEEGVDRTLGFQQKSRC